MEEFVVKVKAEDIEKLAKALSIDMEEALPDFSDLRVIQELGNRFTNECLEELEIQERAELESMTHAHSVPVWG